MNVNEFIEYFVMLSTMDQQKVIKCLHDHFYNNVELPSFEDLMLDAILEPNPLLGNICLN